MKPGDEVPCTITNDDNVMDLAVTKTESVEPVLAVSGPGNLIYVVTVANNGFTDATGVILSETLTLPSGVIVDSITPSAGSFDVSVWTLGDLPIGQSETLTVVLTVAGTTAAGAGVIGDTAAVTAVAEADINRANDSFSGTTSVILNHPPTAFITDPANGSFFSSNPGIPFSGSGSDIEDGVLSGTSLIWTSSLAGPIDSGLSFMTSLIAGNHTITLTATDSQGATGSPSVEIIVSPPVAAGSGGGEGGAGGGGGGGLTSLSTPRPTAVFAPPAVPQFVAPVVAPTQTPTPTPKPTLTPTPTSTPEPTATPVPTLVALESPTPAPPAAPTSSISSDGGGFPPWAMALIGLAVITAFGGLIVRDPFIAGRLDAAARSRALWGRYRLGRLSGDDGYADKPAQTDPPSAD